MPASPIQLSSDFEAECELTCQLEERCQAKAARKAAQAAEATHKAKKEWVAVEKAEEQKAAEKAEEERAQVEKVTGKQVARPTTAKVDPKGLPLVEPVTTCDTCKAAGIECLFWCGKLLLHRLPGGAQEAEGTPKCKRKADDSKGGTPKKLKKMQEAREKMELWLVGLQNPDHIWATSPGQLSLVELLHTLLGEVQGLRCKLVHYTQELVGVQEQCNQAITEVFYTWSQLELDEELDKAEFTLESNDGEEEMEGSDMECENGME
ncbi:hypothetical protein BC628DRAFT_1414494 [Trametes gibbosa]|nr:hypothetical protein BC628DRAFT_1414494 [Trametes gibbosa]